MFKKKRHKKGKILEKWTILSLILSNSEFSKKKIGLFSQKCCQIEKFTPKNEV